MTHPLVTDVLTSDDPWRVLIPAALNPPADADAVAASAGESYEDADEPGRSRLVSLLRMLEGAADPVVIGLLTRHRSRDLVSLALTRRLALPAPTLDALIAERGLDAGTVAALGLSGDPARAAALGGLLGDGDVGGEAALALARLGAREWTEAIARRLSETRGRTHVAFTVALEEMGDPAAVPHLLDWLAHGPGLPAGDVHRALVRLTGRDPLVPEGDFSAQVRRIWRDLDLTTRPEPDVRVTADRPGRLTLTLDEGRGGVRVAYDPPEPGSSWPRWNKTLRVGGHPLYSLGSDCDTCETMMVLGGFPPAEARVNAVRVRDALADLRELAPATIAALEPVVGELETGVYRAALVGLPLERVDHPGSSWWNRRLGERAESEWEEGDGWSGTPHFQVPEPILGPVPTFGIVMPSEPLDGLDPSTVAAHSRAIARGERPTALVLAWVEDKYVQAEWAERHLLGLVLDGHHRLAAYAGAGVPASVLLLVRTRHDGLQDEILDAL
ncbi:hypothetical protein Afil01_39880 [Actinorhabdospora filicis]|uniref:Uncharacterized protein n=1 Tax=Actinorhabdospora filicis TaxID=1785913 RepID=A0A9W6SR31_9ACTN|nr:hypothetical protein [Actinorhabdospora filicis]GLZ79181.1 hypothetical protein Afil01_39880 [Actinorhabdospora filicis]